jgi:hypothetical protein
MKQSTDHVKRKKTTERPRSQITLNKIYEISVFSWQTELRHVSPLFCFLSFATFFLSFSFHHVLTFLNSFPTMSKDVYT